MKIYPKRINELRYCIGGEPYANFEYDFIKDSIKFSCPGKKSTIIFTSNNKEEIQSFWNELITNPSKRKLRRLNNLLDEMRETLIVKS